MFFWAAAALLAGIIAALLMVRAARTAREGAAPVDPALAVYRRQLEELDELTARGVLNDADRKSAFSEAARRLISVPVASETQPPRPTPPWAILGAVFTTAVAALAIYAVTGRPGLPDQPFSSRLSAWKATPVQQLSAAQIAAVLASVAEERPRDTQLLVFLGQAQMAADNPAEAVIALRRATTLAPENGAIQSLLGLALVAASQDESVSPEAETAFQRASSADPADASAQYYLALAEVSRGKSAQGLARWTRLLDKLPPADPRRAVIQERIAEARRDAQAGDAEAKMIAGMVGRLADRLRQSPDDPEGWARLIHAYGVLGQRDAQAEATVNARLALAGDPKGLARLESALKR